MTILAPVSSQPKLPIVARLQSREATLAKLYRRYGSPPVALKRTCEGRALSCERWFRGREFMQSISEGATNDWPDMLYTAGIVVQLGLSCHLLDVGFPDTWCARHIGLHVDRSLAYANATGFGYDCPDTARLITVLSPYWKWNRRHLFDRPAPDDAGFTPHDVPDLLAALLDHVSQVTGHAGQRTI